MLTVFKTSKNAHSWDITPNTGREQKRFYSKAFIGSNEDACEYVTYIQEGKPEFLELVSQDSIHVPAIQESLAYYQINAQSNSQIINLRLENNTIGLRVNNAYINGDIYIPGGAISGDPGAENEYLFSVNFSCPTNNQSSERSCRVVLEDNVGNSVYVDVVQDASSPAITVTPSSVEVPASGGSGSIMISANEEWFVSTVENI